MSTKLFGGFSKRPIGTYRKVHAIEKSSSHGLSMVELMSTLVVVGVLAAVAVPRFQTNMAESELDGQVNQMTADFRRFKTLANKTRVRHFLVFSPSSKGWKTYRDKDGDNKFDATKDSLVPSSGRKLGVEENGRSKVSFGFPGWKTKPTLVQGGGSAPDSGFAAVYSNVSLDDCVDGKAFPSKDGERTVGGFGATPVWVGCGGPTSDMSTGAIYLSTQTSTQLAYAIVYKDVDIGSSDPVPGSLQIQVWRWTKSTGWQKT
jgi:prepilin-type N-terminal cleavage/methylation domain-containing protein